jgi:mannose-6-phosphate isomerase-like protein (cupin superfamily)
MLGEARGDPGLSRFSSGYARRVLETRAYKASSGSEITVTSNPRENGGKLLGFEREMPPGKGKADPHRHLDCEQRYEIVSGTAQMQIAGAKRTLSAGEEVTVPTGVAHRDPYNDGPGTLVFRAEIDPSPEFITEFAEALVHMFEHGGLNKRDELSLLQIFVMTKEADGQSFRAGIPIGVQKALLPLAAAFGRLRGYRASYD